MRELGKGEGRAMEGIKWMEKTEWGRSRKVKWGEEECKEKEQWGRVWRKRGGEERRSILGIWEKAW